MYTIKKLMVSVSHGLHMKMNEFQITVLPMNFFLSKLVYM